MENPIPNQPAQLPSSVLFRVTPLSKALAAIIFIAMPFIGGWVGYHYAPEKVVEVERVVTKEIEKEVVDTEAQADVLIASTSPDGTASLIRISHGDFWKYDGEYYVYNANFESSVPLGALAAFEWMDGGFRYKPLPEDDALYVCQKNEAGIELEQTCEPKLDEIEWVESRS